MYSEANRRETFTSWPHAGYRWAQPDPMAQAGFYHQVPPAHLTSVSSHGCVKVFGTLMRCFLVLFCLIFLCDLLWKRDGPSAERKELLLVLVLV